MEGKRFFLDSRLRIWGSGSNPLERTKQGQEAARRRGVRLGRRLKLSPTQLFDAHCRIASGTAKPGQIAAEHHIAPWSVTRAINRSLREEPN